MESKKINQLATSVSPQTSDLTIIGDPITGVSKKISLLQIANLFATTGTVSSVAVTETGDALTITGSPITSTGTINIGFAGAANQYVRGDGALADFPTSTGGGSSVSYYLNSSVSQGTIGGVAYKELSKDPIAGAGTDITITADGYIASYLTDVNDPALLEVPAGNFNCEFYFSVNSNAHNPYVYAEVYKYDGSTFTLIGSSVSVPEYLTNGTTLSPYYFAIPVAQTVLAITDRIAIRIYANVDTREVTLHTENNHLCQVVTTFSKGLTSLNNLTRQVQFLATGTSGTDFNISSSTATHTFNLPVASATNTGKLSSTDWSTFNGKVPYTGATANVNLGLFDLYAQNILATDTSGNWLSALTRDGGTAIGVLALKSGGFTNYLQPITTVSSARTWTLPDASGTIALTSNINYPVTSVFGRTGAVVAASGDYTTTQVTEGTNLYFTDARARAAITLTTTGTSGAATYSGGTLNIPQYQGVLTNPVTGTGTTNTLPKFTAASTIGNSNITDTGSLITLGSNSFVNGSLFVGANNPNGWTAGLVTSSPFTGGTSVFGNVVDGTIQSGVTANATYFRSQSATAAAAFTLTNIQHYWAVQGTFGAGSSVVTQRGFWAGASLVGATNNYAFQGSIPSGTNRWNLYMDGTAANYLAGDTSIGTTTGGYKLNVNGTTNLNGLLTGTNTVFSSTVANGNTIAWFDNNNTTTDQSFGLLVDAGTSVNDYALRVRNAAASELFKIAGNGAATFSNSVTAASFIPTSSTIPTNGMYLSGTNTLGFATNGTLDMVLDANGALGIGSTSLTGYNVRVGKTLTGSTTMRGIVVDGVVQSDVTANAQGLVSFLGTQATTFTLTNLYQFISAQNTFGAGSTVTNQFGYFADSSLTGATNNYGFYGNIPSGTNRWNLYMAGTAANYMAGKLLIGSTTDSGELLQINGTSKFTGALSGTSATFSSSVTADSLLVNRTASRNMLGISSTSLPTGGDEEGVAVIKTNSTLWQLSLVGYAANSKGLRVYNNGGIGNTSLEVAQAGGTRFIVNGEGNVGIGTSAPSYKFEVSNSGTGVTVGDFYVDTANNSVYVGRQSSTSGDNSKFYVRNRVNTLTALSVDPGGNGAVDVVGTFSTTRGTNLATAIGNVLIGTTTDAGYKLDVSGTVRSTGGFFDTSDSRLKILVKDYEQPKGIENVVARMYVKNNKQELGYYAQDVQEILPSAVNEGEDGFLSLSYSQVHTAKIAYLEDKVAQLEELIKKLL
jgi:hypothetical protein